MGDPYKMTNIKYLLTYLSRILNSSDACKCLDVDRNEHKFKRKTFAFIWLTAAIVPDSNNVYLCKLSISMQNKDLLRLYLAEVD